MMRFIDLGTQIGLDENWPREFAFFNTVPDLFIDMNGSQVWDSWEDFEQDCISEKAPADYIERLKGLCPDWVFTAKSPSADSLGKSQLTAKGHS